MAISIAAVASGQGSSATDADSYATSAVVLAANKLILIHIGTNRTAQGSGGTTVQDSTTPTVTLPGGTTATLIGAKNWLSGGANSRKHWLFRAMLSSGQSGAITIAFPASELQNGLIWQVFEASGMDTSGTNGSGAIVQSDEAQADSATSITGGLAAFADPNNAVFYGVVVNGGSASLTPEGGYTELDDRSNTTSSGEPIDLSAMCAYKATQDTTPNATWTSTRSGGMISVEIKATEATETRAQITARYADNTTGDISAEDGRKFIDAVRFRNDYYNQGNVSGSVTFDRSNGEYIQFTMTGNLTAVTVPIAPGGDELTLEFNQDGTGSHTWAKPSNVLVDGGTFTPTATASAKSILQLKSNGTNWVEVGRSLNVS